MPKVLCISILAAAFFAFFAEVQFVRADEVVSQISQNEKWPSALVHFFTSQYYPPYVLLVDKKARELSVWEMHESGPKKVAAYPADLGKNDGEKRARNDKKTPSGIYFLERKLEGKDLDHNTYGALAFTTNYPNFFDRRDGKGGSGIWFHAVPDSVPLTRGSRGCVVVRNEVIKEISKYIKLQKTPLIIQDEMDFAAPEEMKKISDTTTQMLEQWRQAWQSKNIEQYISYYDEDFTSQGMNLKRWKKFKTGLNEVYTEIKVDFSRPMIYAYKNYAIARILQAYKSNGHEDFGEKLIYLVKREGGYKILGEEWHNQADESARAELVSPESTSASAN